MIRQGLNVLPDTVILPFSAKTKQGREEILDFISSVTS